jgi:Ca2+ transporting ATPase
VIVVTGDNQATAEAVCHQIGALGLDDHDSQVVTSVTGAEFDGWSSHQQLESTKTLSVFARVEPLHKLRLVELLRRQVKHGGLGVGRRVK